MMLIASREGSGAAFSCSISSSIFLSGSCCFLPNVILHVPNLPQVPALVGPRASRATETSAIPPTSRLLGTSLSLWPPGEGGDDALAGFLGGNAVNDALAAADRGDERRRPHAFRTERALQVGQGRERSTVEGHKD